MSKRDVNVILKSILNEIMKLEKFTNGIDYEAFVKDDTREILCSDTLFRDNSVKRLDNYQKISSRNILTLNVVK